MLRPEWAGSEYAIVRTVASRPSFATNFFKAYLLVLGVGIIPSQRSFSISSLSYQYPCLLLTSSRSPLNRSSRSLSFASNPAPFGS